VKPSAEDGVAIAAGTKPARGDIGEQHISSQERFSGSRGGHSHRIDTSALRAPHLLHRKARFRR
jgi:hypothetical protein